jgi:hypothetical protein
MRRLGYVAHELKHHLPYSVFFTAAGITLAGILMYVAIVAGGAEPEEIEEHVQLEQVHTYGEGGTVFERGSTAVFHIFHPIHVLFSAMATTAMFWRYDRKVARAIIVGILGAVVVCGISDIMLPYLSGLLLGARMHLHICILQHPGMIAPFLLVGVGVGLVAASAIERSTIYSHSAHVFVSSTASLFYLVAFGLSRWVDAIGYVFMVVVVAVMLPCCISDIVFPLLLVNPPEAGMEERLAHSGAGAERRYG